jgi:LPXTG-site transpeptidase (sortase) family protein
MNKVMIGIGGLILTILVVVAIRVATPRAVADADRGLSPFTAFPLNDGRNTGVLAPGESRWYEIAPGTDGAFQRQADLTLFLTPDDGSRAHRVNFQIFPADQITSWYWNDRDQMQNLGAGGVVSRDGNPVTGELLWSGWIVNDQIYYIEVSNGTDVTIDYWLFTDNIIAAELGPTDDPPPVGEVSAELNLDQPPAPSITSDIPAAGADADPLLPLASEGQSNRLDKEAETWDVPAGTPTRLVIPAIALDSGVVPVDQTPVVIGGATYGQWNTADNLVGWHSLSARLGQAGNAVLNGHSDVNAAVFRNLEYVKIGDEIMVFSGDQVYRYVVVQRSLVKEKDVSLAERIANAAWIASTQEERLTLVTCANPGATHRLIVMARPLPW